MLRTLVWVLGLCQIVVCQGQKRPMPINDVHQDLRRPISTDNPLFIFNTYGGPEEVRSVDAVLPKDVRPFFAIQFVPPEPYDGSEAFQKRVEAVLDAAEELAFPILIQTEHFNTRNAAPQSYWGELFDKYSCLVGLVWAEISCTGLQLKGLDDDYVERMKATLPTVADHGAYFLWQDMGWDRAGPWEKTPHVFLKAGSDPGLFDAIIKNGDHVILMDKHNGDGKRFVGPAAAMGWWASGLIGQWGVNPEDWIWMEAGYRHLFQPSVGHTLDKSSWPAVFTYPDALFGMEWTVALAGGATVFSLETPFHGFASLKTQRTTPAFDKVVLPLIRMILSKRLIPTRTEVRQKMKIAYQPLSAAPPELNWDDLFKGLYGPEESSFTEWLPSTGRYYFLPILPVLASTEIKDLFPRVIDSASYARDLTQVDAKRTFFDGLYPPIGTGDAWFLNLGHRWFVANPNENKDATASFAFDLAQTQGASLKGNLSPHTFAIIVEEPHRISLHLSNYRIDSEADVWSLEDQIMKDPMDYVDSVYMASPTDDALRRTTLTLSGVAGEPHLDISGHDGFKYIPSFDQAVREYSISVDHNGPIDLAIEKL